ncbi:hypothetical protein BRX37_07535 [Sphingomonas sp. S-NIH.Pt3_0716]|nr:hypothetical protein BRX37_07535 [Sphingomonas sp. S-NIH.Pt3_0716]
MAALLLGTTALAPMSVLAQEASPARERETITVTGQRDKDEQVDLGAKAIQRRNTSNMADLIESISGLHINSLYSRADVRLRSG